MSRRWRVLFHRPVLAEATAARVEARIKLAFEANEPSLDEAGTRRALGAELIAREGRITATNARREAAKRSRDWSASS
ncbi:hypothetical protein [Paracoccus sp. MC1862]|uniref:hypothetical protein n=1 Tax=Paracoccus sp. MC1862 TaxID=2760307 RepID=UPI0015FEF388|nr:hypothetical protein [Paracoccus sp. MC1862]QQO46013.1 hypothetical protein JGR78_06980 [Paracoccus sp. MC1862]